MLSLTNWRYSTVTSQSTTDASMGTAILSSGERPRLITELAMYNGSNTAEVNMRYFLLPIASAQPDSAGQYSVTGDLFFPLGFMNADASTTANDPMHNIVANPFGAKGATTFGLIMPPESILIGAPFVNQNGTIVHKAISAEL